MISVELSYIAKTLDWRLVGQDMSIENLCTDSRQVKTGDCFIALYGDNFDADGDRRWGCRRRHRR